jgi:DNA polymerase-1
MDTLKMEVLPCWEREIIKLPHENIDMNENLTLYSTPSGPEFAYEEAIYVSSASAALEMYSTAQKMKISHISLGVKYKYEEHHFVEDVLVPDIQSIRPVLLSVVMAETSQKNGSNLYSFVVNPRVKSLHWTIKRLMRLPVLFVGYDLKKTLFCLWQLNLPEPATMWDVMIHEKTSSLGLYHYSNKFKYRDENTFNQIQKKKDIKQLEQYQLELQSICQRYGIPYQLNINSQGIEETIFAHSMMKPFTKKQIKYAAKEAIAAAQIYPHQINRAAQSGIFNHLITVEMQFLRTIASIEWAGVGIDQEEAEVTLKGYRQDLKGLEKQIATKGIANPLSHNELKRFFREAGLLNLFTVNGKYSFERDQLKRNIKAHHILPDLLKFKRLRVLLSTATKLIEYAASDGRIHAQYDQLGTVSSRLTSQHPNIIGLDRMLRPLIIPDSGRGIGEADWSQFEVGITAAVYGDEKLLKMFNEGDVYTLMAKSFFWNELTKSDRALSDKKFKLKFETYRKKMKICTLGVIYGMKVSGIAGQLRCSESEAKRLYRKFMKMFPDLQKEIDETLMFNRHRGFSLTATNLRRYRSNMDVRPRGKENWLINHPVQGTAAAIFKATSNRLDKLYRRYDAQIIIPMHDAFIFEAPLESLCEVAELTERVMCETVREFFPELQPKVTVEIADPACWGQKERLAIGL